MSESDYVAIDMGDGIAYLQRTEPKSTTADPLRDHERVILRLHAEVERLRAASGWQPIATAPKDGTPVLAWWPAAYGKKGGHYVALWQDGEWWAAVSAFRFEPTLWQPLPPPPA